MVSAELKSRCRYEADTEAPTPCPVREMAEITLAALYLEGAPRGLEVPRRRWPAVLGFLRSEGPTLGGAGRALRLAGFQEESLAIEDPRLLDWVERRLAAGVVLTAGSPRYPQAWSAKLGGRAPAALWRRGEAPPGPFLAVVGSRDVPPQVRRFAVEVGGQAARIGYALVSGGASGCDRAAARGAACAGGDVLEVLPCGLNRRRERFPGAALSPFAPDAEFSGAQAMIRNTLVYALGEAAVLVQARLGEGGTWNGAIAAHRKQLCPLIVRAGMGRAASALIGIGALSIAHPSDLGEALERRRGASFQAGLPY